MIARLIGEIIDVGITHIIIQVGGVGYLVAVSNSGEYSKGTTVHIHTHLAVRENALDLYGFTTHDELTMFEQLIKLQKIGPKTAIQILSQASVETLRKAVQTNDATYLSKMSGIGKKSAEKIVSGLKDVFEETEIFSESSTSLQSDSDVMEALMALGYSQKDALQAVQKIPPEISGTNERVKHALKYVQR